MGRRLFIAAALILLLLPVALMPFHADMANYQAAAAGRIASLEDVEDHLALRTALITWRDRLLALIGESGSEQVIRGDGMLFYDEEIPDYLGRSAMPEGALDALADELTGLSDALAAEGRRLIVLLAPNKSSVYPEAVPARYLPSDEPSNLTRLQDALAERGVAYLNAQALLLAGKAEGQLYYADDTHWNARGAGLAYQALMDMLALPVPYGDVALGEGQAGDLIVMAQPGTWPIEPDAVPDIQRTYRTARPMRSLDDMRIETSTSADTPSLLVVRDSFGEGLFPYLANSIGRMVYSRVYGDVLGQARQAEAEVVILEIVERNIPILSVE